MEDNKKYSSGILGLNIFIGNKCINKADGNKYAPILLDYNGDDNLEELIIHNEVFLNHLKSLNVFTTNNYSFTYIYISGYYNGEVLNKSINVQVSIPVNTQIANLSYEYIIKYFCRLYTQLYNTEYVFENADDREELIDLYVKLTKKYPDKSIVKATVVNYVRDMLRNAEQLEISNVNYIITVLTNMLAGQE